MQLPTATAYQSGFIESQLAINRCTPSSRMLPSVIGKAPGQARQKMAHRVVWPSPCLGVKPRGFDHPPPLFGLLNYEPSKVAGRTSKRHTS
jgi:hypothetical protein